MDKLLTIAIPTYNRKILLKRALDSILCQMDNRVEVIVSDNASEDGTMEMMKQDYPQVEYSRNEKNIGGEANFIKCCNLANGKYFILFGSDDVLVENSLKKIIDFLEKNPDCACAFINHSFLNGEYIDKDHCYKKWRDEFDDFITTDKSLFMQYAKDRITFMSCLILSKRHYETVSNPEAFFWTHFIHTDILFESLKNKNECLGVIGSICIASNVTSGDSTIDKEKLSFFETFGKGMEYTLCIHAVECGFDAKQMRIIYLDAVKDSFPVRLIVQKTRLKEMSGRLKSEYRIYLKPLIKKYPVLWFYIMPFYLLPNWLAQFIYNVIRPIYRKNKYRT